MDIGIVFYEKDLNKAEEYLKNFFLSLKNQTYKNFQIYILDNTNGQFPKKYINYFPNTKFFKYDNIGFCKGYNILINCSKSNLFLVSNYDMILEKNALQILYNTTLKYRNFGGMTGILMHLNNENKKTNLIDSMGISMKYNYTFYDKHQGKNINNIIYKDEVNQVFGISGAFLLLNKTTLNKIKYNNEIFDEDFFAYKEDIDLSFRFNWSGLSMYRINKILAYHKRNIHTKISRESRSLFIRFLSYKNNKNLFYKNCYKKLGIIFDIQFLFFELLKFIYIYLFEKDLYKKIKDNPIENTNKNINIKISKNKMLKKLKL